jgi:hypothetical protein
MPQYTFPAVTRPWAILLATLPALASAADFVGPETCKACHPAAYEAWKDGPHARAQESLPARSRKDPRCNSCHAPDAEKGVAGVSCETCHGQGGLYVASNVMRDKELALAVGLVEPGEKSCLACHTDSTPSLTRFEYLSKLPLIRHWEGEPAGARKKE